MHTHSPLDIFQMLFNIEEPWWLLDGLHDSSVQTYSSWLSSPCKEKCTNRQVYEPYRASSQFPVDLIVKRMAICEEEPSPPVEAPLRTLEAWGNGTLKYWGETPFMQGAQEFWQALVNLPACFPAACLPPPLSAVTLYVYWATKPVKEEAYILVCTTYTHIYIAIQEPLLRFVPKPMQCIKKKRGGECTTQDMKLLTILQKLWNE